MYYVGDSICIELRCTDQLNALFDPDTVEVSMALGDGSTELVTYGGNETNDVWLSRVSVGVYRLVAPLTVAGRLTIFARWKELTDLGIGELVVSLRRPIRIVVAASNSYQDAP